MLETITSVLVVSVLVLLGVWATIMDLTRRDRERHDQATPLLGVVSPKKKEDEDA